MRFTSYDKKIVDARTRCADLYYEFNQCRLQRLIKENILFLMKVMQSIKSKVPTVTEFSRRCIIILMKKFTEITAI